VLDLTGRQCARLTLQRCPVRTALSLRPNRTRCNLSLPSCRHPASSAFGARGTCAGVPERSPAGSRTNTQSRCGTAPKLVVRGLGQKAACGSGQRTSDTPPGQRQSSEGAPRLAAATTLSVGFRGWHQRHPQPPSTKQRLSTKTKGAEVQCRRHHNLLHAAAPHRQALGSEYRTLPSTFLLTRLAGHRLETSEQGGDQRSRKPANAAVGRNFAYRRGRVACIGGTRTGFLLALLRPRLL
jgi:hypothetical protein